MSFLGLIALVIVGIPRLTHGQCLQDPNELFRFATIRAEADALCGPCEDAVSNRFYTACVTAYAKQAVRNGLFARNCVRPLRRLAAKSVCGRPGRVACCLTREAMDQCRIMRDEDECTQLGGTPSACTSCGENDFGPPGEACTGTCDPRKACFAFDGCAQCTVNKNGRCKFCNSDGNRGCMDADEACEDVVEDCGSD